MNYHLKNNKKNKLSFQKIILISLGILIFFSIFSSIIISIFGFILGPFIPIRNFFSDTGIYVSTFFSGRIELEKERAQLLIENKRLNDIIDDLQAEINWHDNSSGTSSVFSFAKHPVMAKVLLRPPYSPYDTLLLKVNDSDISGLNIGNTVYMLGETSSTTVPIGTVTEIMGNNIRASLFSSPDSNLIITIGTSTEAWTADGQGGGNFSVKLPRSLRVNEGDIIKISAYGGIRYTTINDLSGSSSDPFIIGRFKLPAPLYLLEKVMIDKK